MCSPWLLHGLTPLRPVLACLWIERGLGVVPTEFYKLVDAVVTDTELIEHG